MTSKPVEDMSREELEAEVKQLRYSVKKEANKYEWLHLNLLRQNEKYHQNLRELAIEIERGLPK